MGLFDTKPKDKLLSRIISIESPKAFRESIRVLSASDGVLSPTERRALVLAQNRANAQLKRPNLSSKERDEFDKIRRIRIPKS